MSGLRVRVLGFLDRWLHRLNVPKRLWWRLCDAYDLALGTPDRPENFPRRHGETRSLKEDHEQREFPD